MRATSPPAVPSSPWEGALPSQSDSPWRPTPVPPHTAVFQDLMREAPEEAKEAGRAVACAWAAGLLDACWSRWGPGGVPAAWTRLPLSLSCQGSQGAALGAGRAGLAPLSLQAGLSSRCSWRAPGQKGDRLRARYGKDRDLQVTAPWGRWPWGRQGRGRGRPRVTLGDLPSGARCPPPVVSGPVEGLQSGPVTLPSRPVLPVSP